MSEPRKIWWKGFLEYAGGNDMIGEIFATVTAI